MRRALGLTLIVISMLSTAAAAPAGEAGPNGGRTGITVQKGVTQPAFSYEDAIRETVYVQSSVDGDDDTQLDLIATDIIRPKESDADLKVPVIFEQSPYYQAQGRGNEAEIKNEEDGDFSPDFFPLFYDNYFVPRGYAFIAQDMPGTRNSEGCMVLGADDEELAAKATIDWLNGRGKAFTAAGEEVDADWSTGQVGMIGKSYDGSVANGAASTGVEGLETIVPIGAIDRWYDYHLNNGVQYVNAYTTPGLFVFVIDQTPGDDEERGAGWVKSTFTENSTCSAKGGEIASSAADPRGDYNEFWDERDYLKDVDKVKASVFIVHGLNDWNVKPNNYAQWWSALAKRDVPRKIWLGGTGHVDPFDYRREKWVETLHRWFDHWLHDIDNGIMNQPMADIERASYKWKTYKTWPDAKARKVPLFFAPGKKEPQPGKLRLRQPKPAEASFADDSQQEESQMVADPKVAGANRLLFLTKRLRRSVRLSGRIKVNMRASVDQVDTNFTALLVDYGTSTRIDHEGAGEGVQNTNEESCHGESTEADDACYIVVKERTHQAPYEIVSRGWLDAKHHQSLRQSETLIPGEVYTFKWEIFAEDYVFKKKHQLAIVIAGSDASWTIPDESQANITVQLGSSKIKLPIVGGRRSLRRARI
ncbi:MAG TPA: Xaa-Pro dipeptidyl-peptidase [Actinomycetota bacterium]|nr:Xaa-Pro dipeptidyl-peptidase [Actinomycetota bacterium]